MGNRNNRNISPTTLAYTLRFLWGHQRLRDPAYGIESRIKGLPAHAGPRTTSYSRKRESPLNPYQIALRTRKATQINVVSSTSTRSSNPRRDIASASAFALELIHRDLGHKIVIHLEPEPVNNHLMHDRIPSRPRFKRNVENLVVIVWNKR